MNQTIEAIFEDGVLKPVKPHKLELEEGEIVRVFIKTKDINEEELSLNERYFRGLSEDYIEDVITHALEDQEKE